MLYAYTGTDARGYVDYIDSHTGRMLEVTPGGTYDVRVAPGRAPGLTVPPGDGRWQPAQWTPSEPFTPPPVFADVPLPPIPGVDDPEVSPVLPAPEGATEPGSEA